MNITITFELNEEATNELIRQAKAARVSIDRCIRELVRDRLLEDAIRNKVNSRPLIYNKDVELDWR